MTGSENARRADLVGRLLDVDEDSELLLAELREYGWDSDVELAVIDSGVVTKALDKFLVGLVDRARLEEWAEAIHDRDDLGYQPEFAALLWDILFELSSPELFAPLTHEQVAAWLRRLG